MNPGHPGDQAIGNSRGNNATQERVFAIFTPTANQIIAFIQFRQHNRYISRIVLQVGVHQDNDISIGMINAGCNCGCLSIVAPKYDNLYMAGIFLSKFLQDDQTTIRAAIIHEGDLPVVLNRIHRFMDGMIKN